MSSYISNVCPIAVGHFEKFFLLYSCKLNGEKSLHPMQITDKRLTFHRPTIDCILAFRSIKVKHISFSKFDQFRHEKPYQMHESI